MTTTLKRTEPGRYHASTDVDILSPAHLSAITTRADDGRGWTTRYYRLAGTQWNATMYDEKLADARAGVAAVLALAFPDWDGSTATVMAEHAKGVSVMIQAMIQARIAEYDRLTAELTKGE